MHGCARVQLLIFIPIRSVPTTDALCDPPVLTASVYVSPPSTVGGRYRVGDTVVYRCNPPTYRMVGASGAMCQRRSIWSAAPPICIAVWLNINVCVRYYYIFLCVNAKKYFVANTMKRSRATKSNSKSPPKTSLKPVMEKKEENFERRFFWSCYKDSGFPHRVNHAVASYSDTCGNSYMYSVGGYHADDDQRTVLQADSIGGPFFRRSPIDVHCMDIGKEA